MIIKGIVEEDFINYKYPAMFIAFPKCSFKCEKECGVRCCQNSELAAAKNIKVSEAEIVARYLSNSITSSVVFGGLEPFDTFNDVLKLISTLRKHTNDTVVIYSGYIEREIADQIEMLKKYKNIVVKFGRYIPNSQTVYDEVLGVKLASPNQYAKQIS